MYESLVGVVELEGLKCKHLRNIVLSHYVWGNARFYFRFLGLLNTTSTKMYISRVFQVILTNLSMYV